MPALPTRYCYLRLLPLLLVAGTINTLSHLPASSLSLLPSTIGLDKVIHLTIYLILTLSAWYALPPHLAQPQPSTLIRCLLVLGCCLHGLADEYHQSFIAGRMPSFYDLIADTLGGVLAVYWQPKLLQLTLKWAPQTLTHKLFPQINSKLSSPR